MPFSAADLLLAWVLDAAIGDPRWLPWPHPVVWIGRFIAAIEPKLRHAEPSPGTLVFRGGLLWGAVVGGALAGGWLLLITTTALHPLLGRLLTVYLAYACLATRGLSAEAGDIAHALERGHLARARSRLARIVGRDTDTLESHEVARAGIESVAENSSDGVVAPLFYLTLGGALGLGPLLGVAYKAVNTLDSMVGYRDERYAYLGKISARLDDLANWAPARLTALLVAAAAQLRERRGAVVWAVARRDGGKHKSPNSGWPEAAFAAALGVQLGGGARYRGTLRAAPLLGDPGPPTAANHLRRATVLLWWISALGGILGCAVLTLA